VRVIKKIIFLIIFLAVPLLSSCWDSVEIEKRAFDTAITIDAVEEENDTGKNPNLQLTAQLVVPSGIQTPSSQEVSNNVAFRNISEVNKSLNYSYQQLSKLANRKLSSQHLQVIIISEKVIRQKEVLNRIIDVFVRGQNMRRGMLFAVAKDHAAELLNIAPQHTRLPSYYISTLMENDESGEAVPPLTIGNLQEYLIGDISFAAPLLSAYSEQQSILNSGAAVYNSYEKRMVGTLTDEEAKGLYLILGELATGALPIPIDENMMVVRLHEVNSSIKLIQSDLPNLQFQINISASAELVESYIDNTPFDINELEPIIEEEVKNIVEKTIEKSQKELKTDILLFQAHLEGHHFKLWNKIKNNWEQGEHYFSKSDIVLNVDIKAASKGSTINVTRGGEKP